MTLLHAGILSGQQKLSLFSPVAVGRWRLATDQNFANTAFGDNIVDWDAEDYNDGWSYDFSYDNGRFVIPATVNLVSVAAYIQQVAGASTTDSSLDIMLNGSRYAQSLHTDNFRGEAYISSTIYVSPGDYIELSLRTNSTGDGEADWSYLSLIGYAA